MGHLHRGLVVLARAARADGLGRPAVGPQGGAEMSIARPPEEAQHRNNAQREGTAVSTPDILMSARGLTKRFGGLAAVNAVSLDLWRGRIHAVIGPNGAGKSTLSQPALGRPAADLEGRTVTIGRAGCDSAESAPKRSRARAWAVATRRPTSLLPFSVWDNVHLAAQSRAQPTPGPLAAQRDARLQPPSMTRALRTRAGTGWPHGPARTRSPAPSATASSASSRSPWAWRPSAARAAAGRAAGRHGPGRGRAHGRAAAATSSPTTPCCWSSTTWTPCSRWPTT